MRTILKLLMTGLLIGCSSTTVANNNPSQPIQTSETSSVPPMSSFAIEACNIAFAPTECTTFPIQQHWGEVKEVKIFSVSDIKQIPGNKAIQIYVKSQGCYGYYDSPQQEAWYPANLPNFPVEGKTVTANLIDNKIMSPRLREDFVEIFGSNPQKMLDHCNPLEIKN